LPDRHIDQRVLAQRTQRCRITVRGLEAPDKSRRDLRHCVDPVEIGNEVREEWRVEWLLQNRNIQLGQFVARHVQLPGDARVEGLSVFRPPRKVYTPLDTLAPA